MQNPLSDFDLLTAYTQSHSHQAFATLVARHANLVYGTARRQVHDPHLAQDVSQAVFLILSQKASQLSPRTILSGWLYNTTLYAAANALKSQTRRKYHEYKAGHMPIDQPNQNPDASLETVTPLLDGALANLARRDRDAVLLKFIEGKTHRQVGESIGVSEEAARKRINRSLDRLRAFFHKRGVALSVASVSALLTTHVAQAAPASLLTTSAAATTASTTALAKGTMTMLAWAQTKFIAASLAAALLLTAGAGFTIHTINNHKSQLAGNRAIAPAAPSPVIPILDNQPPANPANPAAANNPIEGIIIGTDGEPLVDCEVFLATPGASISLYANTQTRAARIITEADGKFSFPARGDDKNWIVVATHQQGVATAVAEDLAGSQNLIIKPWGKIEGTLYAADKPLPFESLSVGEIGMAGDPLHDCVSSQTAVKTDKNGHFIVPRVPPGSPMISHQRMTIWMQQTKWDCIEVKPGQTVHVDLGHVGRPVIGKVALPPGWENKLALKPDKLHSWDVSARFVAPYDPADPDGKKPAYYTGMPTPWGWQMMTPRQQHFARDKWDRSPEGIAYRRYMFADQITIAPGGAFRFDALRPGRYMLNIRALEEIPSQHMMEDVVSGFLDFKVPNLPDGKTVSEEPLDIGAITLTPNPRIALNDTAPPFEARTIEGKPLKLADFKGKYLLLHIHPAHYDKKELPGLNKAYEAHKTDPQFAMLTIHLNSDAKQAAQSAATHEWTWPQATGAIGETGQVPQAYQAGPSMIFLVDPNNKVIAKILKPEDVDTEIAKVFLERQ